MIFTVAGVCKTGFVRENNEDAILMDDESGLFAVADGVGGLPNGQLASQSAVEALSSVYNITPEISASDATFKVNEICRAIGFKRYFFGFATTLTFARWLHKESQFEIAHVGDSGAVHVHEDSVDFLTSEHTVAAQIFSEAPAGTAPVITPADYHTLTQCIGQSEEISPQVIRLPFNVNERLFLFSDGVSKAIDEDHLRNLFSEKLPLEELIAHISKAVENAGAPDNFSIVAISS